MPSAVKQLLSIPFARGLSQREDQRWLAPGALITGQNAAHVKTNVIAKRPGCQVFPTVGVASVPGQSATMTSGKRLAALDQGLVAVGQAGFGDALWTFSEQFNGSETPVFKDLVPEVYALPPRVLAGGSGVVLDMDSCFCNGWLVHVWLYGIGLAVGAPQAGTAAGTDVYYQVENAQTGQILIPAQSIGQVNSSFGAVAPKIVACGTTAILTFVTGGNDYTLYATALDLTAPTSAWVAAQAIALLPSPAISLTGKTTGTGPYMGVYDLDSVINDSANYLVCAAVGTRGAGSAATHIKLYQCSAALTLSGGSGVVTSTNVDANDALWTADSPNNTLTAIAIRGDAANSNVCIAYGWASGAPATRVSVQVVQYPTIGTPIGTAVNLMTVPGTAFPSSADQSPQWIAVDRVDSTHYKVYFSPNAAFWDAGLGSITPQAVAYIASYTATPSAGAMTVAAGQPRTTFGPRLASRTLQRNNITYLVGWLPSQTEGTYFLFADDSFADTSTPANTAFPMRLVGTFVPRLASGPALFWNQTPSLPFFASFTLPHLTSNPNAPSGVDVVYSLFSVTQGQVTVTEPNVLSWDFKSPLSYQPAQLGPNLGLACACPSAFDGQNVFEFGFPYSPFIVSVVEGTSGSLVPAATYNYIVVFEKRDAAGLKHRSPRSRVFSHTMGAGKTSLSLQVSVMGFSAREKAPGAIPGHGPQGLTRPATPIMIRVARTAASGTQYNYLDAVDYVSTPGGSDITSHSTAARYNVTNTTTVFIGDGSSDAAIAGNELLYDDGGDGTQAGSKVNNVCPPGFQAMVAHQSRLFGINGNDVWPSKAFVTGEGAGFNESWNFTLDDGPGVLTALASLDDKLILFKRDRVYFMTGFGPTDSGGSNDWTPPQRIASDLGAIDWRSIAVTPQGCYFMSDGGLRLLTRDLQVQPVPTVEDLLAANPKVTSAIVHPTANRTLWTANTNDVTTPRSGIGIDHDTILDTWLSSVSNDGISTQGAVSAVIANALVSGNAPTYHWLRTNGVICRETPSAFFDGAVYVPMTIETAWIKSDALESFARFRRLMVTWTASDAFALTVSVAFDYAATYYVMGTVTAAQMSAMPNYPICQELFALPRQRAQAVRFKIADAHDGVTNPTTGAGPVLVSLGLEWMQYTNRRLGRLPAAQRT